MASDSMLELSKAEQQRKKDESFMLKAVAEAERCEATPSAFSVGAVLLNKSGDVLASGFSRELPGNTHAEQCALMKAEATHGKECAAGGTMYSTMEPCSTRLSGNESCTSRLLKAGIARVVLAQREPDTFVQCEGVAQLSARGVEVDEVSSPDILLRLAALHSHLQPQEQRDTADQACVAGGAAKAPAPARSAT